MTAIRRLNDLLAQRRPGHSLPQPLYNDPSLYALDVDGIFHHSWLMVGFTAEIANPGDYLAETIGASPILLVRQKDGSIIGFYNSCRHRGAQLCADGHGRNPRIVCPYHQWTYGNDGELISASRMGDDFDKAAHSLRKIAVEEVAGCLYVCLAEEGEVPDFEPFRQALEPMLLPHNLAEGKLAFSSTLIEHANWKLVMENGRECHHCAVCHPELKIPFPVNNADSQDREETQLYAAYGERMAAAGLDVGPYGADWWNIGRFPFNPGTVSFSLDGKALVGKPLVTVNDGDVGTLRWAIEPHNFCHAAGDNVFMFSAYPVGPLETRVVAKWIVHKDAVEGVDYDIDRLTHIWTQTNLQDRDLAENNQRGVNGAGYRPGPYSPDAESYVNGFIDWYCRKMSAYAEQRNEAAAA